MYIPPYSAENNPEAFNPGYEPTFWEDPRNVARAYWQSKGQKGTATLSLDGYQAHSQMPTNISSWPMARMTGRHWKYLAPNDPARSYLQSIGTPPLDYYIPPKKYQEILTLDLLATPAEQRNPNLIMRSCS